MSSPTAPNPSTHLNSELTGKTYGGKIRFGSVVTCTILSRGIIVLTDECGRVRGRRDDFGGGRALVLKF